jgi:hypothetical protein
MSQREKFVEEINRLKIAIKKTKSIKLRNDYTKAVKRMLKELAEYDRFMKEYNKAV